MKILLALVAGAVNVAAFAPLGWWPVNVLSLGVLFAGWLGSGRRAAAWQGFAYGVGLFGGGVSWVYVSLHGFGGMAPALAGLCIAALVAGLALVPAGAGFAQGCFVAGVGRRGWRSAASHLPPQPSPQPSPQHSAHHSDASAGNISGDGAADGIGGGRAGSVHRERVAVLRVALTNMFNNRIDSADGEAGNRPYRERVAAVRVALVMPGVWVVFEWLRGWVMGGFPWLSSGYAMLDTPLAGWAPLGGVYLVGMWAALTAAAAVLAVRAGRRRGGAPAALAAAAVVACGWLGGGYWQGVAWSQPSGAEVGVALVQNNVPLRLKWEAAMGARIIDDYLTQSAAHPEVDLVVWPEAAAPDYLDRLPAGMMARIHAHGADFAFGTLTRQVVDGRWRDFNSIAVVTGGGVGAAGEVDGVYGEVEIAGGVGAEVVAGVAFDAGGGGDIGAEVVAGVAFDAGGGGDIGAEVVGVAVDVGGAGDVGVESAADVAESAANVAESAASASEAITGIAEAAEAVVESSASITEIAASTAESSASTAESIAALTESTKAIAGIGGVGAESAGVAESAAQFTAIPAVLSPAIPVTKTIPATNSPPQIALYHKRHLVPFGEFLPMRWLFQPLMARLDIPMSDFTPWPAEQAPLRAAGVLWAASICYEDAFPALWRRPVRTAGALLNVSEDAWFGDSLAPHQRLQMARFRALESARPMVRSANGGLSAVIDWRGGIKAMAPQFTRVVLRAEVRPRRGITPYIAYGDWLAVLAALALWGFGVWFARRAVR